MPSTTSSSARPWGTVRGDVRQPSQVAGQQFLADRPAQHLGDLVRLHVVLLSRISGSHLEQLRVAHAGDEVFLVPAGEVLTWSTVALCTTTSSRPASAMMVATARRAEYSDCTSSSTTRRSAPSFLGDA